MKILLGYFNEKVGERGKYQTSAKESLGLCELKQDKPW